MRDGTIPNDRGPRATPEQIKQWYREVSLLLNRLEGAGEVLTLHQDGITGGTGVVLKHGAPPKNWSWQ
jgi:hypothetical protein